MNVMIRIFFLALFLISSLLHAQTIDITPNAVILSNGLVGREISASPKSAKPLPQRVIISSSKRVVMENASVPWFEFHVAGTRVSSLDAAWTFLGHTQRTMMNGGSEFTLSFRHTAPELQGLLLHAVIQMQPRTAFFRERIILTMPDGEVTHFSVQPGRPLFSLGGWNIPVNASDVLRVEEIRMATWNAPLIETAHATAFDPKSVSPDNKKGRNLEENYMYHPVRRETAMKSSSSEQFIGPFIVIKDPALKQTVWTAFEHGAPDGDPEQEYIRATAERTRTGLRSKTVISAGAICDGQEISRDRPWRSIWTVAGMTASAEADAAIWTYLYRDICENPASRRPLFYYNTWGMQRDESMRGADIRGILTEKKIVQEIEEASQLGVDLFVLDDGWQDKFGDWNIQRERFPNGLKFYVELLRQKGIMPGLWIAPIAADPDADIAKQHPEWLIRRPNDSLVVGQWEKNFFCFDSDFKKYFVEKCKAYIDLGIRYFKWDGINKYLCASPLHHHGTTAQSPEVRRMLQGYDIPLLVTEALNELKAYQPDLIVEIDVTEPERSVGLAILSEARYFWMNNGSSTYGDYSTYRAKSTRMITNLYGSFMPTTLQTYACFPMYDPVYKAQWHNVYSSIIGGRGFWGNIARMKREERERAGDLVRLVKPGEAAATSIRPTIVGTVGASPEVYEIVNKKASVGKVLAFSGSALKTSYVVRDAASSSLLGVVNHAFSTSKEDVILPLEFYAPDDAKMAVLVPNNGRPIRMRESTCWLRTLDVDSTGSLRYVTGAPGKQLIQWGPGLSAPTITSDKPVEHTATRGKDGSFTVEIKSTIPGTTIHIN